MTPLLFWKIIGYGILGFFALGIVVSIVSAAFTAVVTVSTVLFFISVPLLFLAFYALSIATYPVTLLLRARGFHSKSLFTFGCEIYEAWKEKKEKMDYWPGYQQQSDRQANSGTKAGDVIAAAACLKVMSSNRLAESANVFDRSFPFFE